MSNRALISAVNAYPGCPLRGCLNDAKMIEKLIREQFAFTEVTSLLDAAATRDAIVAGLKWLLANAQAGDVLLWHWSGHGTWIEDTNGDELDGRDEAIVPYDSIDDHSKFLIDDQLAKLIGRVPKGVNLTVFLDSCFSGSALRDGDDKVRPRLLPSTGEGPETPMGPVWTRLGEKLAAKERALLISATSPTQTAADAYINADYHGAATFCLDYMVRDHAGITPAGLMPLMRFWLGQEGYSQTPGLYGNIAARHRPLFSAES